jgi:WD40 repeat protein
MTKSASPAPPNLSRHRRLRRILGWAAGITLCLLLAALAARSLLISQMRLPRLMLTQTGTVTSVAVTPNGRTVFTGNDLSSDALRSYGNNGVDVFAWDAATGRPIRRLPGFYRQSSAVAASPDGRSVIADGYTRQIPTASGSYRVTEWNWHSGQKQWAAEGGMPLCYAPNGQFIGCESGIYNASTGKLIRRTSHNIAEDGQCAFTPDGKLFGVIDAPTLDSKTGYEDDNGNSVYSTTRLHFWHTDTGKEAKDFPFTRVRAFDIARVGQWLVNYPRLKSGACPSPHSGVEQ